MTLTQEAFSYLSGMFSCKGLSDFQCSQRSKLSIGAGNSLTCIKLPDLLADLDQRLWRSI